MPCLRARLRQEEALRVSPGRLHHVNDGLGAQLAELAPLEGGNAGSWVGLTTYRFSSPAAWIQDYSRSLSLLILAQGRHELTVNQSPVAQSLSQCVVLPGHDHVDGRVLEASFGRPYLCVVLEIDPGLVRRVLSKMTELHKSQAHVTEDPTRAQPSCEHRMLEVVIRAESSLASDIDRRVLQPLYEQEIVYWLLRSDQARHVGALAAADSADPFVPAVIEYARQHLAESPSVSELAAVAHLSTSAFAHRFRNATGRPPYQFMRDMRLYRARELLAAGDIAVSQVAKEVGYSSVSQFSRAFRIRFGVTPRSAVVCTSKASGAGMGSRSTGLG